ncbi:hypothetical protein [Thalassobacillus sp. CUG 92003]|uniref:hypothetical protein n=1 Tax=Thalassobacillus sp. CUG 92003 TaxID=2736641 RepID=UPI0015E72153|nr:hypothetical protein [Thalassobacillus sp. CUG 92003]
MDEQGKYLESIDRSLRGIWLELRRMNGEKHTQTKEGSPVIGKPPDNKTFK